MLLSLKEQHILDSRCSWALTVHIRHAQAVGDDEFESIKKELHGAGTTTLRFAESAEQQHMEVDLTPNELPQPALSHALATRLAPVQGPSSDVQPAPVRPPTQVSVLQGSPSSLSLTHHSSLHFQ